MDLWSESSRSATLSPRGVSEETDTCCMVGLYNRKRTKALAELVRHRAFTVYLAIGSVGTSPCSRTANAAMSVSTSSSSGPSVVNPKE